jgi:polyisoprenoid-binding protein YceI
MKKLILAFSLLVATITSTTAQTLQVDGTHSSVTFNVPHMGISVIAGSFSKISGTYIGDGTDITKSKITFTIDAASINTGSDGRDKHLKSGDFFDVEKNPEIKFESTSAVKDGSNYKLMGNITLKGVTKPATFIVTYGGSAKNRQGGTTYGYTAKSTLTLADFGIDSWMQKSGVGKTFDVAVNIEMAEAKK